MTYMTPASLHSATLRARSLALPKPPAKTHTCQTKEEFEQAESLRTETEKKEKLTTRKMFAILHHAGDVVQEANLDPKFDVETNVRWMIANASAANTNADMDKLEKKLL